MAAVKILVRTVELEQAIACRNWKKGEVLDMLGIGATHFSQVLQRKASPGPDLRKRMMNIFGMTFDELFLIKGKKA